MFSFAVSSTATIIYMIDPASVSQVRGNVVTLLSGEGRNLERMRYASNCVGLTSKVPACLSHRNEHGLNGC